MEGKKTNFEMAEYDHEFIDRMMDMGDEGMLAYLHSLPEAERKMLEEAIYRAISQRALREHKEDLGGGLTN
ncbi:MAG TPA: hypothetical protein VF784_10145 [Anaerolineales bacterium]